MKKYKTVTVIILVFIMLCFTGCGVAPFKFDYNDNGDNFSKEEIHWKSETAWGNSLAGDRDKIGNFEVMDNSVLADTVLTGAFSQVFYNDGGLLSDYLFKADFKLNYTAVDFAFPKMGFFGIYQNDINQMQVFLHPKENIVSYSTCQAGAWTLWEVAALPAEWDFDAVQTVKFYKKGNNVRMYLNDIFVFQKYVAISDGQVGLISEGVNFRVFNYTFEVIENFPSALPLSAPQITLDGGLIIFNRVANAMSYKIKIDGYEEFECSSGLDIEAKLKSLDAPSNTYGVQVLAVGDGVNFSNSQYSDSVSVSYTKPTEGAQDLSAPIVSINGDSLTWSTVENASSYKLISGSYEQLNVNTPFNLKAFFEEKNLVNSSHSIIVKAIGDGESFNDSANSNAVTYNYNCGWGGASDIALKGVYEKADNKITLTKTGGNLGVDNYSTGYDKIVNTTAKSGDFRFSATVTDKCVKSLPITKYGIQIAVSNTHFLQFFLLPDNTVTMLAQNASGGFLWNTVWKAPDVTPTINVKTGVNIMAEREGGILRFYINDILVYTETALDISDKDLYVGFVSEANEGIEYNGILTEDLSGRIATPVIVKSEQNIITFAEESGATYRLYAQSESGSYSDSAVITSGYDLDDFIAEKTLVYGKFNFTVAGVKSGAFNSERSNSVSLTLNSALFTDVKGEYSKDGTSVTLNKMATVLGDNYSQGYDRTVSDLTLKDFEFSCDISLGAIKFYDTAKVGIKLQVSETNYYTFFLTPINNSYTLLSTKDGGATWVQIWGSTCEKPYDSAKADSVNVRIKRVGGEIDFFINNVHVWSDSATNGADSFYGEPETALTLAFTGEACEGYSYNNIVMRELTTTNK